MGDLKKFCSELGITLITSSPMNQYQDGVSDRSIDFVQSEARPTFLQTKLPTVFWSYGVKATVHVIDRTGQSTMKRMTPIQKFYGYFNQARITTPMSTIYRLSEPAAPCRLSHCRFILDTDSFMFQEPLEGVILTTDS
ncbi:hypothetical protein F5B21DRAFT_508460 [Xylaria acuta]|nr:hypothetical protein F5B21DRAFT_508460 [Xylaria acuta]